MSYKTIIAYLARTDGVADIMNTALPLAEKFEAHLTGIHVTSGVPVIGTIGAQVPPEIIDQFVQHMHEDAEAIESSFAKAVKGAQVQTEWRQSKIKVVGTDVLNLISEHTRCADIVVMGQSDADQCESGGDIVCAQSAQCPKVVLDFIVPHDRAGNELGEKHNEDRIGKKRRALPAFPPCIDHEGNHLKGIKGYCQRQR